MMEFKLLRRLIAKRRVETQPIVVLIEELFQVSGEILEIAILIAVNFFLFEGLHKALASRIVIRIGRAAHAGNHAMSTQQSRVIGASVLHAAIGVMHQTRWGAPIVNGLL